MLVPGPRRGRPDIDGYARLVASTLHRVDRTAHSVVHRHADEVARLVLDHLHR